MADTTEMTMSDEQFDSFMVELTLVACEAAYTMGFGDAKAGHTPEPKLAATYVMMTVKEAIEESLAEREDEE